MSKRFLHGVAILIAYVLSAATIVKADDKCTKEEAHQVMRIAVSIERLYPDDEIHHNNAGERIYGSRGTGWRFGLQQLATIGHVALGLKLNEPEWKDVTILQSDAEYGAPVVIMKTKARISYLGSEHQTEAAAIIELADPLPDIISKARIRSAPLARNEPVMAVGYAGGMLRVATGNLAIPEQHSDDPPNDTMLPKHLLPFELADHDKNDRYAIDHGASGGPILDCDGNVVGITSQLVTQDLSKNRAVAGMIQSLERLSSSGIMNLDNEIAALKVVTTAWGQYNIFGLPVGYFPTMPR